MLVGRKGYLAGLVSVHLIVYYLFVRYNTNVIVACYFCSAITADPYTSDRFISLTIMANKKKQLLRIIFDVLDSMNQHILLNVDRSIAAADPDEAIDMAYDEMQRQFKGADIRLTRVRIGFSGV